MDASILESIGVLITGPASAIFVCLVFFYFSYKMIVEKAIPSLQENVDKILAEHREDRLAWQESIKIMSQRLEKVEDEVKEIKMLCLNKSNNTEV